MTNMTNMTNMTKRSPPRRPYRPPELRRWGTVADITLVGQTNPGDDTIPGSTGRESGSIDV